MSGQPGMAVELLRFAVPAEERDAFLEVETSVWTTFLQARDGFVAKEVWYPREGDDVIVAIWWASYEQWKAIGPEACAEVDERMGEWLRPAELIGDVTVVRRFG